MSFFYDLNARLAKLATKQDAKQISEDAKATAPRSKLAESLDVAEAGYSAKAGRAGKDLGKPGKNFSKIAKSAGEKYGSKAAGERVAGAVLNKLRHPTKEAAVPMTSKQKSFAKLAPPTDKITFADKIAGAKQEVDEMLGDVAAEAMKKAVTTMADEGNAFTGKLNSTPKGSKFKLGNKEFKDTSSIEEETMDEGYAEMDAWLKNREKEKGTGKFDRKERTLPGGMKATTYTRRHEEEPADDSDAPVSKGGSPKKKGRPAGTRRAIGAKHSGRSKLASKDAIAEEIPVTDRGEYDDEAGMAKDQLHTIVRHAKKLEQAIGSHDNLPEWVQEKMGQIKGMMTAVTDYMLSQKERGIEQATGEEGVTLEKAPPGAKAERMVKHIKKSLSKDGNLSAKDKAIAYATTWKAKKAGKVEEESTDKEDTKAEKAGKKVAKDIEHDEGHKASDDNRAEKAGKKVTKDIEYDDKKDKEEKVDETTTSGSVATATAAPKASKGMQFGKGVYESLNKQYKEALTESMNITVNMNTDTEGTPQKSITVTATDEDADKLAELLKMAGLEQRQETCQVCGEANCGCDAEVVDENSPDWPTNTETKDADPNLRTYSGGLNGPKSTGQTTVPVVASQLRRQVSMEEGVKIERSLFQLYKNYKAK